MLRVAAAPAPWNPYTTPLAQEPLLSANLADIHTAADLLRRVNAEAVLTLLQRLGYWVGEADREIRTKQFPRDLADLTPRALGNENGYWQSELSRVIELNGALRGHRQSVELTLKRARARALKSKVDALPEGARVPTKDVLAASVAEHPDVMDAEDAIATLDTAITTLDAVISAYEGYTRALSREISRRSDEIRAGL